MNSFIALLGGLGIGSLLATIVQSILQNSRERKDLLFTEKKEAYVGLLEALQKAATDRTDEAAKEFAYWQFRCDLVGSVDVQSSIVEVVESNGNPVQRAEALKTLKMAMRTDLGL